MMIIGGGEEMPHLELFCAILAKKERVRVRRFIGICFAKLFLFSHCIRMRDFWLYLVFSFLIWFFYSVFMYTSQQIHNSQVVAMKDRVYRYLFGKTPFLRNYVY